MKKLFTLIILVLIFVACQNKVAEENTKSAKADAAVEQGMDVDIDVETDSAPQVAAEELTTVLNERLKVYIPEGFGLMDQETLNARYPMAGNRPNRVYTNAAGDVNLALNRTKNRIPKEELSNLLPVFKQQYDQIGADIMNMQLKQVNDLSVIEVEVVTGAGDASVYNHTFVTSIEGRMVIVSFNCPASDMDSWKDVSEKIGASLRLAY